MRRPKEITVELGRARFYYIKNLKARIWTKKDV